MNALDIIAANLAKPITHNVVSTYVDGATHVHGTRSAAQAENFAKGMRQRIGLNQINRESGKTVRIISVEIVAL